MKRQISNREGFFNTLALVSVFVSFLAYLLHFATSDRWTTTLTIIWVVALGLATGFEVISRVYGRVHVEEQPRAELETQSQAETVKPTRIRLAWGLLWAAPVVAVTAIFVGDFSESGKRVLYGVGFACLLLSFALTLFRQDHLD